MFSSLARRGLVAAAFTQPLARSQALSTTSTAYAKLERSQAPKTQTTYKKPFTPRKQYLFTTYDEQFAGSKTVLIVQHHNLSGSELTEQRRELKMAAAGARLMVVRPKMVRAVLRDTRYGNLGEAFVGPTAIVCWDQEVELEAVKKAMEVVGRQKKMVLVGAKHEDMILNAQMLAGLVNLPPIETLRAQVVGVVQAPAQQLAGVLKRIPQRLVGVLKQKAEAGSD
ncbi:hypothetical protein LPJ53_005209 [Coemansia erecta]|uniref:Ribosomal protein L10 n=1 Tax=Coemansia erecta TaxID=147472 RepID=A0A9W7XW53_9FUNG|nr:hypothetical protein LPJ53_005209 [Coemansia erecta]